YRLCGHSKSDKLLYRTREEEEAWKEKDPILRFIASASLDSQRAETVRKEAMDEVEEAWNEAYASRDQILTLEEAEAFVTPEAEPLPVKGEGRRHPATYREAVREALAEIFRSSSHYTLMGEDIGVYGGCFGVTGNLIEEFPDRIWETPVSEEAFIGLASGAAMLGEHPIAEIMYADFMTLASDGIINHAAKAYFMSAGQLQSPMVVRAAMGGGTGHGAQHTQCLENMFLNKPGLKVVAPSGPYSAKALLKSAAKDNCPVLFFEHKGLYNMEGECGGEEDFLPLGKAIVSGEGKDLLVIGYSRPFAEAKKALSDLSVTYLDIASLKPLDEEAIREYGSRFKNILIVQDTPLQGSVAETVIRILSEVPGARSLRVVGALDMPLAFSKTLERTILPSGERIRREALEMLGENHG
ncbi:MAG: pyruvate dehydrogenase, partial [Spirochaetales bacterium]|nr:pyruvate dehydrogenase [Candidatus Physcosoma equi]